MARAIKLINAPVGLFDIDGVLVLKTEYSTQHDDGAITPDCYIVDSGEYFWGGVDSVEERNNLMVTPIDIPTLTPPNEWVSVEERLPKYNIREDGELVSSKILCYCETDKTVHLAVSQKFYIGRMGEIVHPILRYYDEWGYEVENVSHWMPLPAPTDRRSPEGGV